MVRRMVWGRSSVRAVLALPLAALAGAPVSAAQSSATVTVNIVKPLSLTSSGSLNFGTIVMNSLTASRTVSLSPQNVLTCGGGVELACSGATSVPTYNVQGTNRTVISIAKTPTMLTNSSDGSKLTLTLSGPTSITLANSGAPGENFTVGGSITLTPSTNAGLYSGTVNVTVDYQ